MNDRFAEVRHLKNEAVARIVAADRQWWRLVRNRHLRCEAIDLLDRAQAKLSEAAGE